MLKIITIIQPVESVTSFDVSWRKFTIYNILFGNLLHVR